VRFNGPMPLKPPLLHDAGFSVAYELQEFVGPQVAGANAEDGESIQRLADIAFGLRRF